MSLHHNPDTRELFYYWGAAALTAVGVGFGVFGWLDLQLHRGFGLADSP